MWRMDGESRSSDSGSSSMIGRPGGFSGHAVEILRFKSHSPTDGTFWDILSLL